MGSTECEPYESNPEDSFDNKLSLLDFWSIKPLILNSLPFCDLTLAVVFSAFAYFILSFYRLTICLNMADIFWCCSLFSDDIKKCLVYANREIWLTQFGNIEIIYDENYLDCTFWEEIIFEVFEDDKWFQYDSLKRNSHKEQLIKPCLYNRYVI